MDIPTDLVPSSMMSQPEVIESPHCNPSGVIPYNQRKGENRQVQQMVPEKAKSTAMSEPQCYYNETIAFFYNRSGKYLATEWNTVSKLVMGLGITVCIFIMLANLLVMVAIYVNRRFHFPIYYLMANLAAADFFAGLAYFYLMFNTGPNTRRLTVSTWLLRQGLIDTSLTASVANLLAIAIERHITVFRMQLHTRMSNRRVVVVIVVIWTMAIVMGAIPSVGWNCICDITHCSNMAPLYSDSYLVFWAIFNLVTFVVMVVLYAHIFGYVRQRTMRMSRHSSGPRRNRDTMMSLLKTVVIVLVGISMGEEITESQKCGVGRDPQGSSSPTLSPTQDYPQESQFKARGQTTMKINSAFIICWTPGLVLLLLDVCCPQCNVLAYEKFFLLLAEFNSAMNPIIYSYRDKEMSATFKQILCCQRSESANGPTEGSDRSASSLNHTILAGVHSNDHSVV
ncbi:Lysophosphatidic acid receptor 1 [Pitangus sulphuratus]|nr:Lysophosphatidic acid receptor 1 [Pitangus sulphuratus]